MVTKKRRAAVRSQPFRFLDLQAELRYMIYELAIAKWRDREAKRGKRSRLTDSGLMLVTRYTTPPLLQTCRRIRSEAMPIYHRTGRFTARSVDEVAGWLEQSGIARPHEIQSLQVEFSGPPAFCHFQRVLDRPESGFIVVQLFNKPKADIALRISLGDSVTRLDHTHNDLLHLLKATSEPADLEFSEVLLILEFMEVIISSMSSEWLRIKPEDDSSYLPEDTKHFTRLSNCVELTPWNGEVTLEPVDKRSAKQTSDSTHEDRFLSPRLLTELERLYKLFGTPTMAVQDS